MLVKTLISCLFRFFSSVFLCFYFIVKTPIDDILCSTHYIYRLTILLLLSLSLILTPYFYFKEKKKSIKKKHLKFFSILIFYLKLMCKFAGIIKNMVAIAQFG